MVPCTSCDYCAKACPAGIGISGSFGALNVLEVYGDRKKADGELAASIAYNYGVLKMGGGDAEAALELFLRSVSLNPSFASAWTNAGVCRMSLERHAEAADAFRKALSLDPDDPVKLVNLAAAEAFAGNRAEAVSLLRPLIESGRADSEARALWDFLGQGR